MNDYIDFPIKNPSTEGTTTNNYHFSKVNYAYTDGQKDIDKVNYAYTDGQKDIDIQIKKIWERLNKTVALVHNCQNCGARLEVEENHPIFHCKYCGSTYIIGSVQPNSIY